MKKLLLTLFFYFVLLITYTNSFSFEKIYEENFLQEQEKLITRNKFSKTSVENKIKKNYLRGSSIMIELKNKIHLKPSEEEKYEVERSLSLAESLF